MEAYSATINMTPTIDAITRNVIDEKVSIVLISSTTTSDKNTSDNIIFQVTVKDAKCVLIGLKNSTQEVSQTYIGKTNDIVACSYCAASKIIEIISSEILPIINSAPPNEAHEMLKELRQALTKKFLNSGRIKGSTQDKFSELLNKHTAELKSSLKTKKYAVLYNATIRKDVIRAHYLIGENEKFLQDNKEAVIFAGKEMSGAAVRLVCKLSGLLAEVRDNSSNIVKEWARYEPAENGGLGKLYVNAKKFAQYYYNKSEHTHNAYDIKNIFKAGNELLETPIRKAKVEQQGAFSVRTYAAATPLTYFSYKQKEQQPRTDGGTFSNGTKNEKDKKAFSAIFCFQLNPEIFQINGFSEDTDYWKICNRILDDISSLAATRAEADKATKTAVLIACEVEARGIYYDNLSIIDTQSGRTNLKKYTYDSRTDRRRITTTKTTEEQQAESYGNTMELIKKTLANAGIELQTEGNKIIKAEKTESQKQKM